MAEGGHCSRTYSASLSNDIVVGVDDKLDSIRDRLTRNWSKLNVLSIVGMGGIGKTTIAQKIYDDSSLSDYFDVRLWTTLSQKFELVDILLGLLQQFCQGDISKIDDLECSRTIGEQLWKGLKNRRYLVVIDDIWDVEAWKSLRFFFPDDCTRSRIILTSRNVEVAEYANLNYPPYELSLMDPETSWELLSKKVFLRDSCPEELAGIGNVIAFKCHGLPLAINLVAGHLSKVGRTSLDWLNVEKQLLSVEENVLDILALIYNYLPAQLKKCFLFAANEYAEFSMRLHGRNQSQMVKVVKEITNLIIQTICGMRLYEMPINLVQELNNQKLLGIPTKKLMLLWIAAGYIQEEAPRTLEDVAEKCLQELISRNLVIVTNRGSSGIPKNYIVHDLMIDMCKRLDCERVRTSGDQGNVYSHDLRPFAFIGSNGFRSNQILQSASGDLKHLEFSNNRPIPTSVYKHCNLQTLINPQPVPETLPMDIWMMSQLRHLHVGYITNLPSSRQSHTEDFGIPILKNLQSVTLSSISCTREICVGIPNLRRLKLYEVGSDCNVEEQSLNCLNNLCFLAHLQNLRLSLPDPPRCLRHWKRHWKSPPPNLRKLTLEGFCLGREDTAIRASLPNLEVLKLKYDDFEKDRWELKHDADIFHKLRFLLLESFGLHLWEANSNNFPNLRHLVLCNCFFLKRIPLEMAEICTLQVVELHDCSLTVEESARHIQQELCDMGNDDFKVHIKSYLRRS